MLGDDESTYDEVNEFYNFWYDFDSWREYSYLDEEEKEKGENREERRYLDKQNKVARNQRKKEEMQRIRQLVDNAYQCDPRVARFKEEEKKRRQELKQAKAASIKAKKDEEERLQREKEEKELAVKKKQEEEEKQRKDEERRQKEAAKKKLRQENKQVESIFKSHDYFTDDPKLKIEYMQELDKLCKIYTLEQLIEFRIALQSIASSDEKRSHFLAQVEELNKRLTCERIETATASTASATSSSSSNAKRVWNYADIQLLIKGVKLFPAGTQNRWSVIANFINDKSDSGVSRNHRDVLEKAKELQNQGKSTCATITTQVCLLKCMFLGDSQSLKEEVNKNAFKQLETQMNNTAAKQKQPAEKVALQESNPSERYDGTLSYWADRVTYWETDIFSSHSTNHIGTEWYSVDQWRAAATGAGHEDLPGLTWLWTLEHDRRLHTQSISPWLHQTIQASRRVGQSKERNCCQKQKVSMYT